MQEQTDPTSAPLATIHLPGRSRTLSAWSAFLALILLLLIGICYPLFLRESVRFLFWAARPLTGLTITSRQLTVELGKPLLWQDVLITTGTFPHESRYQFRSLSLGLTSPWRLLFGDHLIIDSLEASDGRALLDLSRQDTPLHVSFLEKTRTAAHQYVQHQIAHIPTSVSLNNISFLVKTENQHVSIEDASFSLSQKNAGKFSYKKILIKTASLRCELPKTSCTTIWNGVTVTFNTLFLSEEIQLHSLQLTPLSDRIEFGLVSTLFHGLLRADGSIRKKGETPHLEGALLAQNLPMERLSKFLGLTKKISGNLRESRLIFRGSPLHVIDAEASLRILADNFRYGKKEWAALSMTANLINRKFSLSDFQLKQHDNYVIGAGEMSLPQEWHKIAQAPFHLKLKATISDVTQLGDLAGPPWNDITGRLLIEGEIQGGANRAEGFLKAQGNGMAFQGLSVDTLKLDLLFQNKKTTLTNCELWSECDHLQCAGIIDNSWPHQYEAKASLQGSRFLTLLDSLHIPLCQGLHDGTMTASWTGEGNATAHEGSFNLSFCDLMQGPHEVSGHCAGSYTPYQLLIPKLLLEEGNKRLVAKLTISPQGLEANNISLSERGERTLSGNLFLPIDLKALWNGGSLASSLILTSPLQFTLASHFFFFAKKMLQGEPIVASLPDSFGAPLFFFKKSLPSLIFAPFTLAPIGLLTQLDHKGTPEMVRASYFYWK